MIDINILSSGSVVWGVFIIALCLTIIAGKIKIKNK
jgi:hypothetical protein